MSSARTCPSCNWVFPSSYTRTRCKFCDTLFKEQICYNCKQLYPTEVFTVHKSGRDAGYLQRECRLCAAKRSSRSWVEQHDKRLESARKYVAKHKLMAEESLEKWLKATNLVFKPLTEDEWLMACAYFSGCAMCGEPHIETRQYFIPFQLGGKYAAWNIFPMCGKCSTVHKEVKNPFLWLDPVVGRKIRYRYNMNQERADRLLEYFILQIEKAGGRFE